MDDTEYVIRKLANYSSHDEIIMALCERRDYKWEKATEFVHRVELEHFHRIRIRQRPFLILAGILMVIAGAITLLYSMNSWLRGELMPLILTLWIVEFYFPNGGQLVGLALGGASFIGGVAGICLAARKEGTTSRKRLTWKTG